MKIETLIAIGRMWAKIFYGYQEYGVDNIPRSGPCILGINHPGKLLGDMFAALAIIPHRKPIFIAPEGMMQSQRIGVGFGTNALGEVIASRLLRMSANNLPSVRIRRGGDSPVIRNLEMLKALSRGEAIFLAVEGEVSWDGRPNQSRSGAPWLALRSGVPFIPIGITGSYDVWPRWEANPKLMGKITVRIGKPVYLCEETPAWIDEQMIKDAGGVIMEKIRELVG